jgi:hypothetical protein
MRVMTPFFVIKRLFESENGLFEQMKNQACSTEIVNQASGSLSAPADDQNIIVVIRIH